MDGETMEVPLAETAGEPVPEAAATPAAPAVLEPTGLDSRPEEAGAQALTVTVTVAGEDSPEAGEISEADPEATGETSEEEAPEEEPVGETPDVAAEEAASATGQTVVETKNT
jgi:hypothetical protein